MPKTYKGITVEIGAKTTGLSKALNDVDKQSNDIQKSLKAVNDLLKLDPKNTEFLAKKQELLAQQVNVTSQRLKTLSDVQEQVNRQFKNGTIDINAYTSFNKELITTKQRLEAVKAEQEKLKNNSEDVSQSLDKVGDSAIKSGDIIKANLTSAAIISGLKAIANGVKEISEACIGIGEEFDSSMSQVAATMGITSEQIAQGSDAYNKLRDAAKETGATTSFTASQSAEALNYLALAGYDVDKSIATLPKTLTLAKASGMDLATATDMITDAMSALKLSTSDTDTYIDQMAKTAQKSNTSVQQLGEATLECAGTISSTGQSLTTMNTSLGVLADNGIKGAEAGTKLRNILLSISAPTDSAQKSLDNLGVTLKDSKGNIRDISDVMTDLNNALANMSSGDRTEAINNIFNKTDLNAVNALLSATSGRFSELSTEIENSTGAAQAMADTMSDNLEGDITRLKSSLEGVGISIYEKFELPLRKAIENSTTSFEKLNDSVTNGKLGESFEKLGTSLEKIIESGSEAATNILPKLIDGLSVILDHSNLIIGALSGLATAGITRTVIQTITKLVRGFSQLANVIKGARAAQLGLNAAQSASPIGSVVSILGLAVGAFIAYKTKLEDTKDATSELVKESQNLNDTIQKAQDNRQENIKKINDEYDSYAKLADQIYKIADSESLTNDKKGEMLTLIDELNEKIPNLNLKYDETTKSLSMQKDEVQNVIDKTKEMYRVQAAEKDLSSITEQQYNVEKKIAELQEDKKKKYAEYLKIKKEEEQFQSTLTPSLLSADDYYENKNSKQRIEDAKKALNDINEQITKQKENLKALDDEYSNTQGYIAEHSDSTNALTDSLEENTDAMSDNATETATQAAKLEELSKNASNTKSEIADLASTMQTLTKQQALSTDQVLNLISKYPELAKSIQSTKDGYKLEQGALESLIKIRAKNLELIAEEQAKEQTTNAKNSAKQSLIDNGVVDWEAKYLVDIYKQQALNGTFNADNIKASPAVKKIISDYVQQLINIRNEESATKMIANDILNNGYKYGSTSSSKTSTTNSTTTKTNTSTTNKTTISKTNASTTDKTDKYAEKVEKKISEIEHNYKMGKLSATDYYTQLSQLNEKYYKGKEKYLERYNELCEKVYTGLQEAEKDRIDNALTLHKELNDIADAQAQLYNARNKKVRIYSEQGGWGLSEDASAVKSATQTLEEAKQALLQTKINMGSYTTAQLTNIANRLPYISDTTLNATKTQKTADKASENTQKTQTTNNDNRISIIIEKVVTPNANDFAQQMQKLIKQSNRNRMVGK